MFKIWSWLKMICNGHKAAFNRRKTHVHTFYINLHLRRVRRCRSRCMAVWGRGGRSPCPCLLSNPCALGSFTPPPSWKALDQRSELTNSPCRLSGKCACLGQVGGEWERETGIRFLQTSGRYLNSVGRSAVWNGVEFRIAITQSRQSVKYAFFSFI